MHRIAAIVVASCLTTFGVIITREASQAQSEALPMATQVNPVARSPVTIERCRMLSNQNSQIWATNVVIGNRTRHGLANASVAFTAYDPENVKLAQTTIPLPFSDIIASADTSPFAINLGFPLGEITDAKLVARISCRIASADFTGNRHWRYPQRWPEPLLKLAAEAPPSKTNGLPDGTSSLLRAQRLSVAVTNAWSDLVGGTLYIHDAIAVRGSDFDQSLRVSDLVLQMRLSNGSLRSYPALAQPAPTYQRIDPLGSQTATVNEVDPSNDLGRIGTMTVPAHGRVTTTVTFAVADPVVDKSDDRGVSVK